LQSKNDELQRNDLLQQQLVVRLSAHENGWSGKAWSLAETAAEIPHDAAKIRHDVAVRDSAAAALVGLDELLGLDEKKSNKLGDIAASSVLWSADGSKLLFGGTTDTDGKPREQARIWDSATNTYQTSELAGGGAIAWRGGKALHAVVHDSQTVLVREIANPRPLMFKVTSEEPGEKLSKDRPPLLTFSSDGSRLAFAFKRADDSSTIVVWEVSSGEQVWQGKDAAASALALTARRPTCATTCDGLCGANRSVRAGLAALNAPRDGAGEIRSWRACWRWSSYWRAAGPSHQESFGWKLKWEKLARSWTSAPANCSERICCSNSSHCERIRTSKVGPAKLGTSSSR
jgi:hypothetical protein